MTKLQSILQIIAALLGPIDEGLHVIHLSPKAQGIATTIITDVATGDAVLQAVMAAKDKPTVAQPAAQA